MQRLIFDYNPIFVFGCLLLGIGYAWLLYTAKYSWSKNFNRVLFVLRSLLASALFVLLLGPVFRQTTNLLEKPALVFLIDNSRSIKEAADTALIIGELTRAAQTLGSSDWQVEWSSLDGVTPEIIFNKPGSDLSAALKQTTGRYEGKNLAGIVLVSDGIYNNGLSPLYQPLHVPVYAVGTGDTVQRADLVLKNVAYNRVVYQGNKFPLRAEVGVSGLPNAEVTVTVMKQGRTVGQATKNSSTRALLDFDFQLDAATQGTQRFDVVVTRHAREANVGNNRSAVFIEVVEGKKKIVLIAASPHPDIKAFRSVVEKNPNYEFLVHLPGVKELPPSALDPQEIDLLIAHQSPDAIGRTTGLLTSMLRAKVPALVIVGQQTQLRALSTVGVPVAFEPSSQRDEVQPVLQMTFSDFGYSPELGSLVARYPPVSVPFGKLAYPGASKAILVQQIGNVVTDRPMLFALEEGERKVAVLIGDGIWKWRLSEFQETGKTIGFDELFSKLIQYLSTKDDRRRFRSFPVRQEFSSDGPALIESQVYNELFEPVYGNTIDIELRGEDGKASVFRYVTAPGGGNRYRIGGLKEGIYRFTSSTELNGKREIARGEFLVVEQNQESRNLTADFGLLRKLAESTEGKFYSDTEIQKLATDLASQKAAATLHSEETFNPLINLKLVFFLLLLLVSAEWFLRKFAGAY